MLQHNYLSSILSKTDKLDAFLLCHSFMFCLGPIKYQTVVTFDPYNLSFLSQKRTTHYKIHFVKCTNLWLTTICVTTRPSRCNLCKSLLVSEMHPWRTVPVEPPASLSSVGPVDACQHDVGLLPPAGLPALLPGQGGAVGWAGPGAGQGGRGHPWRGWTPPATVSQGTERAGV